MYEKNDNSFYAEIVLICILHIANHYFSSDITSKTWQMNVQLPESSIKVSLKKSIHLQNHLSFTKFSEK